MLCAFDHRVAMCCNVLGVVDLNLMQTLPNMCRYMFAAGEKLKHTSPGQQQEPIELVVYQDKCLCVVEAIKQYTAVSRKVVQQNRMRQCRKVLWVMGVCGISLRL